MNLKPLVVPLLATASLAALPSSALAAFPSNNGKIAFVRNVTPTDSDIFTVNGSVNATGGVVHALAPSPGVDADPAWSPDGTKIAFTSDRGGNLDIYVMNADGTGVTQLTTDLHSDSEPAWSPDGTKIAFTSNRDGDTEIFVMNADGSGQTQLTHNDLVLLGAVVQFEVGRDEEPAWSPDGTKIAFISDRPPADRFQLFTMNADGSGQAALGASAAQMRGPSWAPGGTRIAVATGGFAGDGVYLASAASGALTSLANAVTWDTAPAYSPDGTKIVYRSTFNPNGTGLYTMDADGTGIAHLTLGRDYDPDWQPCATCPPPPPKPAPTGNTGGGATTGTPTAIPAAVPSKPGGTVNGKPTDNPLSVFADPLASGKAPVADAATSHRVRVTPARVLPGDVLAVSVNVAGIDTTQKVHLLGITTRGLGRCAAKSRTALRRWLFDRYGDGRPMAIVTDPKVKPDSKGLLQVYVERKAPAELQIWLLRYGLAKLDRSAGRFRQFPRYWTAQERAKKVHKGVWGGC